MILFLVGARGCISVAAWTQLKLASFFSRPSPLSSPGRSTRYCMLINAVGNSSKRPCCCRTSTQSNGAITMPNEKESKTETKANKTKNQTRPTHKEPPAAWWNVDPASTVEEIMTCASSNGLVWRETKATEQETKRKSPYERHVRKSNFLLFGFVSWLDCLLLKEGPSAFCSLRWLLEVFLAIAEFVVFAQVVGFHLNDCIEYFTPPCWPPLPLWLLPKEHELLIFSVNPVIRRKFSQTSDNMERWKSSQQGEESEEKRSEERRCRCAKT